jgi:hypothetical protein
VATADATAEVELTLGLTIAPLRFTAPSFGIRDGVVLSWLKFAGRRQESIAPTKMSDVSFEEIWFVNIAVIMGEMAAVRLL